MSDLTQQAKDVLEAAAGLTRADQQAFIEKACADNDALLIAVLNLDKGDLPRELRDYLTQNSTADHSPQPLGDTLGVPAPTKTPTITIDGYDELEEIARGGQGIVFKAIQGRTNRKVAIKVLLQGAMALAKAKRRFQREIELVAQLKHPGIISVFHSGETADGHPYCVMDYVRGQRLDHFVRDRNLTLEDTLLLFKKVCEAVQYAHHRGVIHRDLKPGNILVDHDGNPRILDFGLAKMVSAPSDVQLTMTHHLLGTLPYMSPEQARGNPDEVDTRADIYALGVILYELLTGEYPYPVAGHTADVLKHIADTQPAPPVRKWSSESGVSRRGSRSLRLGQCPIDDELQTVILKLLAKERERRYQSAGELSRDLERYLAGDTIEAKRDSLWYVLRKRAGHYRWQLVATSVAVAALISFALFSSHTQRIRERTERVQHSDLLTKDAKALLESGNATEGLTRLDEALSLHPHNWIAMYYKAAHYKDTFHASLPRARDKSVLRQAEQLCNSALEIKPADPHLLNLRAVILYSGGRYADAEEDARAVLAADPSFFHAASNLAKVLTLQRRLEEAVRVVEEHIAAIPKSGIPDTYADGIWITLAALQAAAQDPAALSSVNKAIELDGIDYRNHLFHGRLLLMDQHFDLDGALRALIAASLPMDEHEIPPLLSRTRSYARFKKGDYAGALSDAVSAFHTGGEPAYCHLLQAMALAGLGDHHNARLQYEAAVTTQSEFIDGTLVTAGPGLLWIDTRAEYDALKAEAERRLAAAELKE
jgi:serine/threonine protein kinase